MNEMTKTKKVKPKSKSKQIKTKNVFNQQNKSSIKSTQTSKSLNNDAQQIINESIFKNGSTKCNKWNKKQIVSNCSHSKRAFAALKYYLTLCSNNESIEVVHDELDKFFAETYDNFVNDYIHIITKHGNDILKIGDELQKEYGFEKCIVNKCVQLRRHYYEHSKNVTNKPKPVDDIEAPHFYIEYFDQLHHFIFHLYDVGIRIAIDETKYNNDYENATNNCIDEIFAMRRDIIRSKRKEYSDCIRRYDNENNKYNMQLDLWHGKYNKDDTSNGTFLEGIFLCLTEDDNISDKLVIGLKKYLYDNDYDTDAIEHDLNDLPSNISNYANEKLCIDLIRESFEDLQLTENSFSTGFAFVYWDELENKDDNLHISPNYESIKEEILCSGFVSINQWNKKVMSKAQQYHKSSKMKNIKYTNKWTQHGWAEGVTISLDHIVSVILYCDFSKLSTHFSASFRKNDPFESIQGTKARHANYYYFGKALVETVIDFGDNGKGVLGDEGEVINKERGPFYCGLNFVMKFSSFAIKLKGPCSTSKHQEVTLNFAKRDGIIMQFNNEDGNLASSFNCSWISKYNGEDERLFIHEIWPLTMESVVIIETQNNYQQYFHALHIFDAMLSGVEGDIINVLSSDVQILNELINHKLNIERSKKIPKYVCDTFDLFCHKKETIEITIRWLKYFKQLSHLIMHSVVNEGPKRTNKNYATIRYTNNSVLKHKYKNILKPDKFRIFKNLKTIIVNTTYGNILQIEEYPVYKFSLLLFLSFIQTVKPMKCEVIARRMYEGCDENSFSIFSHEKTWIQNAMSPSIKDTFNEHKWNIEIITRQHPICKQRNIMDVLIITKKK
eukprot:40817_1